MFLLHKIARISYTIGVYMKLNPKQHSSMYYDANTHNRRRNSDINTLMLPWTEKSHLDGTVTFDESKMF